MNGELGSPRDPVGAFYRDHYVARAPTASGPLNGLGSAAKKAVDAACTPGRPAEECPGSDRRPGQGSRAETEVVESRFAIE
jgi:hypothetical protein